VSRLNLHSYLTAGEKKGDQYVLITERPSLDRPSRKNQEYISISDRAGKRKIRCHTIGPASTHRTGGMLRGKRKEVKHYGLVIPPHEVRGRLEYEASMDGQKFSNGGTRRKNPEEVMVQRMSCTWKDLLPFSNSSLKSPKQQGRLKRPSGSRQDLDQTSRDTNCKMRERIAKQRVGSPLTGLTYVLYWRHEKKKKGRDRLQGYLVWRDEGRTLHRETVTASSGGRHGNLRIVPSID